MANDIAVANAWRIKEVKEAALHHHGLGAMADTGEVDIRRFVRIIYRRKLLLLLTIAVCLGATVYWLSRVTPSYSADVLIVIENRPSSIVKVDAVVEDVSSDTAKVNTEVAILESRGLAAKVIDGLNLREDPEFAEGRSGILGRIAESALSKPALIAAQGVAPFLTSSRMRS